MAQVELATDPECAFDELCRSGHTDSCGLLFRILNELSGDPSPRRKYRRKAVAAGGKA
jgi:hypothetical protein